MYLPPKKAQLATEQQAQADDELRREREIWTWRAVAERQLDEIDPDDPLVQWLDEHAPPPPRVTTTMAMRELPDAAHEAWEVRWIIPGHDDWQSDAVVRVVDGVLFITELTVRLATGRTRYSHQRTGVARQLHLFGSPSKRQWDKIGSDQGTTKTRREAPPRQIDNPLLSGINIKPILDDVRDLLLDHAQWRDLWAQRSDLPDLGGSSLREAVEVSELRRPRPGGRRPARNDTFYALVARTVLDLQATGSRSITKSLHEQMHAAGFADQSAAPRTAEGWIRDARKRGYLAPHTGKHGTTRYEPGPQLGARSND